METLIAARRTIVEHLPVFLQLRRRKWTGLQDFLDESQLTRPVFFLLRALEGETVSGQFLTLSQMQQDLFNPYMTRFTIFDQLPVLVERGYLQQQNERYCVTDAGRMLMNQCEIAARAYISSLKVPPAIDQAALATVLVARVYAAWQAPEPLIKAHEARTQRRLPIAGAPALVQIEWAVLGLWEARDDAHIAAWKAYQFTGPVFDILSRIWSKEASTLPRLLAILEESQQPADVRQGIQELLKASYILLDGDHLELTVQGQKIRDAIEVETDRIFFGSWNQMTDHEVIWLSEQLNDLCAFFRELA